MAKIVMIGVIAVQLVLLIHSAIAIDKLNNKVHDYQEWFSDTEIKIEELRATAQEMRNICEQYLNQDLYLPDDGNNQSK